MHDLSAFANRLRKQHKLRRSWACRVDTDAYRLYEMDIPEFRYIVDVYADHVVLYDKRRVPPDGDDDKQLPEEQALVETIASVLSIPMGHVHLKRRRRQPGRSQYEKLGSQGVKVVVREEATRYLVNLSDYLDTGLFLDHRPMRREFRRLPPGSRLLNLFCYTGSVTVAAGTAGARTKSVDMSKTYLDWALENIHLNDLNPEDHVLVREDALRFLADGPAPGEAYDVIFLDPPTFSNSKRMRGSFDVQRDHRRLIMQALDFLVEDGVLYFSTNRGRFRLDPALTSDATLRIEDITRRTIPEDFRDPEIHRCFVIRRGAAIQPKSRKMTT